MRERSLEAGSACGDSRRSVCDAFAFSRVRPAHGGNRGHICERKRSLEAGSACGEKKGGCCKICSSPCGYIQNSLQDCRSQSPVGKYFSETGDSAVRVTRLRKVFPEVGATTPACLHPGGLLQNLQQPFFYMTENRTGFERTLTFANVSPVFAVRRAHSRERKRTAHTSPVFAVRRAHLVHLEISAISVSVSSKSRAYSCCKNSSSNRCAKASAAASSSLTSSSPVTAARLRTFSASA